MNKFYATIAEGYVGIVARDDGGVGIHTSSNMDITITLSKDETLKLATWLLAHIDENIRKA